MIFKKGGFNINGIDGMEELHAFIENMPAITFTNRKRTLTDIDGSSEQIILDNHGYSSREVSLNIVVRAYDEESRVMRLSALISAFNSETYIPFTSYSEPNMTYFVINNTAMTPTRIAHSYDSRFTVKLTAKAFKQYRPDESVTVKGTTKTFNRFNYASRPLIHILNSGVSTIAINGKPYTFGPLPSGGAWVDCEESQQDVYNGNTIVENAFAVGQEFPSLPPGIVTITAGNAVVYPRWRTI